MNINVGELRAQSAYCDGRTPVLVITSDQRLKDLKLRVVAFYPDTQDPFTKEWKSVFKIKIEVDDLGELPPEEAP